MPQIDRQREHQANERTFLAWLRTSIALIGFGFAIARFGLFLRELQTRVTEQDIPTHSLISSQSIGVGLVVVGILLIILAVWRYNQIFWQIEQGNYQPNRLMVWLTATIVVILGLLSIPFILWRQTTAPGTSSSRSSRAEHYSQLQDLRRTSTSRVGTAHPLLPIVFKRAICVSHKLKSDCLSNQRCRVR
jgi:putative membrane protein